MNKNPLKLKNFEEALQRTVTKDVNGKRYNLLKVSWKDSNYGAFLDIIDYTFLRHLNLLGAIHSLSFLNNNYSDQIGRFFHIFYNNAFKTNQAVWRFEDEEFQSFTKYLIYRLIISDCVKNRKKSALKNIDHNLISANEVSKIIEFIKQLEKLEKDYSFYQMFDSPESLYIEEGSWDGFLQSRVETAKKLFILLRESNEILSQYISTSDPLFNYLPKKLEQSDDEELFKRHGVFEENVRALLNLALIRIHGSYFIYDNIKQHSKVDCFTERSGVFYKVLSIRNQKNDTTLKRGFSKKIDLDYKSTEERGFMTCVWLVKNIKEKLYFPACSPKEVRIAAINILDSYLKRDVIVRNTLGTEENINDTTLYICKESFLEFAKSFFKKYHSDNNKKSKRLVEFCARLEADINSSPNKKLLPKISYNGGNSYSKIGIVDYGLSTKDVQNCWDKVVGKLTENHPWRISRRPKKDTKKS